MVKSNKKVKLIVVIVLLAIGYFGWNSLQQNNINNKDHFYLYGNVDIREVQLAFRQTGRIDQMYFDEGDQVKTGQVLASIDAIPFEDALAVADANVLVAQAELDKLSYGLRPQEITQAEENLKKAQAYAENARKNYERHKKLLGSGAISKKIYDQVESEHIQAQSAIKAAQAALSQANEGYRQEDIAAANARLISSQAIRKQAEVSLEDTKLIAPSNGTIISRVREVGSMINSQSTVYSLSLDNPVYIRAYISEKELGFIAPGKQVIITSDSSAQEFIGTIGFISPKAEFTPKSVETTDLRTDLVYRLRIVIKDSNAIDSLRQGMPVSIKVDKGKSTI